MRRVHTILSITMIALFAAASHAAEGTSTISLRSTVLLAIGHEATLADIAELRGPEAARLGATTIDLGNIDPDPAGWRRIDAQLLRTTLEDAHWGLLELRGGPCYVRTVAVSSDAQGGTSADPTVSRPAAPGTVRALAERWIAQRLNAPPRDVEVLWTSATEGLLDHAATGLTPYIDDAGRSDRMRLEIVMYDDEARVVVRGKAEATLRVRRDVAVLTRNVRNRRVLNAGDVRTEQRWIGGGDVPALPDRVIDREAAGNLEAGSIVGSSDVHESVAIERNERVQVRVITPTVTVSMLARARRDGRPGEVIEFETIAPARGDRTRFNARVEGPGSAVMVSGSVQP